MPRFINYKHTHYNIDKISSYTDIELFYVERYKKLDCYFRKEFSFCGDKLIIEEHFDVPQKEKSNGFFKKVFNPVYYKLVNKEYQFDNFKKENPDKEWLDFIKYVAKEIGHEKELNKVIEQSQIAVDLLNKKE